MAAEPLDQSPLFSARNNRASGQAQAAAPARPEIDYTSRRFLVIDAVQEMRIAMSNTLTGLGVSKVDYANRAAEAITILKRTDVDVVLCDCDLGRGSDGLHLLDEVRARSMLKPSAAFIIISGERRAKMVMCAAEFAADGYVLKPFTGEMLKRKLDRILLKKAPMADLDAAIHSQDYLRAIEECTRRITREDPRSADYLRMKGQLCLQIGDYAQARAVYVAALNLGERAWATMGLAKAAYHLKEIGEARRLLEDLISKRPRHMEAYDLLAQLHLGEHQVQQAQGILARAADISPIMARRQQALGEVAMKGGDYASAVEAFGHTIANSRHAFWRDPVDYLRLSKAQLGLGDHEQAIKIAADVRKEFRGDAVADLTGSLIECQVAVKQGQINRADQLLQKIKPRGTSPDMRVDVALEVAEACFLAGDESTGTAIAQRVLRNQHDDTRTLARVSRLFDNIGRPELGQELIERNAQAMVAINNEAVMMAQAGDLDGAVLKFARAVEEMPANVALLLNAVNAMLAYVARRGWHNEYMGMASHYLDRVRQVEPANGKYLRLREAYLASRKKFRV